MMDPDCVFCKIIKGEILARIVHQDEMVTVFEDIQPVAPIHYLLVPNKHIPSVNQINPEDSELLAYIFFLARDLAVQTGISETGYRLMINTGKDGSQTVDHLHMHLIGGRQLMGRVVD